VRLKQRFSERDYFAHDHVIVSYNGDLRGIVEDFLHKQRRVRCSVASFSQAAAVVDGSRLLATVPSSVARYILRLYPHLKTARLPIALHGSPMELLWPQAVDDDEACRFVRGHLLRIAQTELAEPAGARAASRRPISRAARARAR
jgi:LysR family transcriptional activator of mexEF-oprN operon